MKNPFTHENSNLSNIFHNNIHRKKVESLKVRSTEEFFMPICLASLPILPGSAAGAAALKYFSARFSESLVSLMHNLENLPSFICFCWRYNLSLLMLTAIANHRILTREHTYHRAF